MRLIASKKIRNVTAKALREARRRKSKDVPRDVNLWVSLGAIDDLERVLKSSRRTAIQSSHEAFSDELSAAYIAAMASAHWGMGLTELGNDQASHTSLLLPRDFINSRAQPDPNLLLGSHFTIIANQTLAIITLAERGLEMSARPMVRTLQEFCCLVLVLVSDQKMMKHYCSAKEPEQEKEVFYRHFTPKKLNRAVSTLEKKLNSPVFSNERKETHEFYSSSTHMSYIVSFLSSYGISIDDNERVDYALFGKTSIGCKAMLFEIFIIIWHFLSLFRLVMIKLHKRSFPEDNAYVTAALGLKDALDDILLALLESRRAESNSV